MSERVVAWQDDNHPAVTADADADGPGRATLTLRLPYSVEQAFLNAFEIAVDAAQMIEFAGHGILDVLVFAPPP